MKFEIEIDDNKMQEAIQNIVFDSRNHSGLSFGFQKIIREAFQEKVKEIINDDQLIEITNKKWPYLTSLDLYIINIK